MNVTPGFTSAPRIETERLILRAQRTTDLDAAAEMWRDPLVTKFIGGKPFTRQETWTKLLRYVGHWQLLGYGYWVIEEKSSGRFMGEAGFADFKRDLTPSIDGLPEVGWSLVSAAHGRGLGTEAVRAVLAWGDQHFTPKRAVCIIDHDNAPSIRLATKCGFREWQRTTYAGTPTILFER